MLMNPTFFAGLRNVLAQLFSDEPSIRRIVDDAGLDGRKIDFGSSAINIWHFVLTEAEKVDRVEALFRAVESAGYGNNRKFRDARQAYYRLLGEAAESKSDKSIHQNPETRLALWQQRLPAILLVLLLLGLAGCGTYWAFNGSRAGVGATSAPTSAPASAGPSAETSAEKTLTPAELPTATVTAALPSPTSTATTSATATAAAPLTSTPQTTTPVPQPTATVEPTLVSAVPSSLLCDFAFLVLDDQSEEPIRRASIAVFVGTKQETGTTDSTGYYLAHLPCTNERDVEARVRVSADGYSPYNRSVFLSDETTEVLLERKTPPTPTLQPMVTETSTPSSCTATVVSTGATQISLRESATGDTIGYLIAKDVTVLILTPSADNAAYKILYNDSGREIVGWLPADNLRLSTSCPR